MNFIVIAFLCLCALGNIFQNETWDSGLIDMGNGNDMFYIHFKARNYLKGNNTPIILWLTGGPGCSGFYGLYMENGPYWILRNGSLVYNPYSWNNNSDVIYIDQPIGTGFSKAANKSYLCHDENCVSRGIYIFLLKIYDIHPEFQKRPLYIIGESYGGKYVPSISAYLLRAQNPMLNLKGYAVGNGLTDPIHQVGVYPRYLYDNGRISSFQFLGSQVASIACIVEILFNPNNHTLMCDLFWGHLRRIAKLINPYNIYINYTYGEQTQRMVDYLNLGNVQQELGVSGRKYSDCSYDPGNALGDDFFRTIRSTIEFTVQSGIKVLIYAGDYDFECNWESNRNYLKFVNWDGKKEFNKQKMQKWMIGTEEAGEFISYKNLKFLRFYRSGHMVPMDKPMESLQLVNDFTEAI